MDTAFGNEPGAGVRRWGRGEQRKFGALPAIKAQSRGDPWLCRAWGQPGEPSCLGTIQEGGRERVKMICCIWKPPFPPYLTVIYSSPTSADFLLFKTQRACEDITAVTCFQCLRILVFLQVKNLTKTPTWTSHFTKKCIYATTGAVLVCHVPVKCSLCYFLMDYQISTLTISKVDVLFILKMPHYIPWSLAYNGTNIRSLNFYFSKL